MTHCTQCQIALVDDVCPQCHVHFSEECPSCQQAGYHAEGCPEIETEENMSTWQYIMIDHSEYLPVNTEEEIEIAKERLREEGKDKAVIYECPSFESFENSRVTSDYIFA